MCITAICRAVLGGIQPLSPLPEWSHVAVQELWWCGTLPNNWSENHHTESAVSFCLGSPWHSMPSTDWLTCGQNCFPEQIFWGASGVAQFKWMWHSIATRTSPSFTKLHKTHHTQSLHMHFVAQKRAMTIKLNRIQSNPMHAPVMLPDPLSGSSTLCSSFNNHDGSGTTFLGMAGHLYKQMPGLRQSELHSTTRGGGRQVFSEITQPAIMCSVTAFVNCFMIRIRNRWPIIIKSTMKELERIYCKIFNGFEIVSQMKQVSVLRELR